MDEKRVLNSYDIDRIFEIGYDTKDNKYFQRHSENDFIIKDCQIKDAIDFTLNATSKNRQPRSFIDCIFLEKFQVDFTHHSIPIIFINCVFKENVEMKWISNDAIFQGACCFEKSLLIEAKSNRAFEFKNLSIYGNLYFQGRFGSLKLHDINKQQDTKIGCLKFSRDNTDSYDFLSLQIFDCDFDKVAVSTFIANEGIIKNISAKQLDFTNIHIGLNFTVESCRIEKLFIDNIHGSTEPHRFFEFNDNPLIKHANIVLSTIEKVDIQHSNFEELILTGTLDNKKNFNIEYCEIESLAFIEVANEGLITIRSLSAQSTKKLEFYSSNMGKTEFFNCDFSKTLLSFHDSRLTEVFPISTDFPSKVANDNYDQCRLFFSQLHTVFTKQGDSIRALEYQAIEVETHYNKLKLLSNECFTVVALFLNKISTSFGRNWFQGFIFTLVVGLIFFYALIISTKEYCIDFAFNCDWRLVPAFFRFMNPLRFIELENLFKFSNENSFLTLSNCSYIWDSLGRIFIAFGVYQTIQAFRKYGRK